jgi:putative aldouronate transport system substrate-binding protein
LIDPDFINQDETAANDNFVAGKSGLVFQPWWAAHANIIDLYAAFPEAKISIIANPKGPEGKSGRAETSQNGNAMLFRKGVDPKIIEAVIKQINWQTEMHVNWDKYQQYGEYSLGAGWFKGYEWDFDADCKMVLGKVPGGEWTLAKDLVGGYRGMSYPDYPLDTFSTMATWMKADPATLNMSQKFIISDPTVQRDIEYYNFAANTRAERIENQFKGRNTEAINAVLPDLLDFEKSTYLEFITGARALDTFDQFVKEWLERGGQTYTDEVNKWASGQ